MRRTSSPPPRPSPIPRPELRGVQAPSPALAPLKAASALRELVRATGRMPESTRAMWSTRFTHVYGDLSGQRALDLGAAQRWTGTQCPEVTLQGVLFGVQTYFVLVADLLAAAAVELSPPSFLRNAATLPPAAFLRFLRKLSAGTLLAERGIHGGSAAFDFDWYVDALDASGAEGIRSLLQMLATNWGAIDASRAAIDPLNRLYSALMPRNFLHILGEVYTPGWLAEMLVADSGWRPGQRLIDPFGGSGVFVLAALRAARQFQVDPLAVLPDLCLVDLNPIACVAARANLILALADSLKSDARAEVWLPVLSGDALAPALVSNQVSPPQGPPGEGKCAGAAITGALARYGVRLPRWVDDPPGPAGLDDGQSQTQHGTRDRRFWEQLAIVALRPADVVATNPPWVGWEYISRPYRTYLHPAWETYGLFNARGRNASFLKEDLSTLALVTAWDRYLKNGGTSVAVLRTNTMSSTLAAQGLRRLSIFAQRDPLRLSRIRVFKNIRVFPTATVEVATWQLTKGQPTSFPVAVDMFERMQRQPGADEALQSLRTELKSKSAIAERVVPGDATSRWIVGSAECVTAARQVCGTNPYVGRTGVFTGGANAVYYLQKEPAQGVSKAGASPWFLNVTHRAKRAAPSLRVQLEPELVYQTVRGRDLTRWASRAGGLLLLPHTRDTRMSALSPATMQRTYPKTWEYLCQMRPILDARKGFTQWERTFRDEAFYAVQRVGEYTFAPYKVAWRYIASDFLVAVIGPDREGRPRLANDKVMFVGVDEPDEAFYLCGVLSSDPVRWKVNAYAAGTQISANVIESLAIQKYDSQNSLHAEIARACQLGHQALEAENLEAAQASLFRVNLAAAQLFRVDTTAMQLFRLELQQAYRTDWPQLRDISEDEESPGRVASPAAGD